MVNDDLFTWKVKMKDKNISLIMDFSNPTNYDSGKITKFEKKQ